MLHVIDDIVNESYWQIFFQCEITRSEITTEFTIQFLGRKVKWGFGTSGRCPHNVPRTSSEGSSRKALGTSDRDVPGTSDRGVPETSGQGVFGTSDQDVRWGRPRDGQIGYLGDVLGTNICRLGMLHLIDQKVFNNIFINF